MEKRYTVTCEVVVDADKIGDEGALILEVEERADEAALPGEPTDGMTLRPKPGNQCSCFEEHQRSCRWHPDNDGGAPAGGA